MVSSANSSTGDSPSPPSDSSDDLYLKNPYLPQEVQNNAEKSLGVSFGKTNIYTNSSEATNQNAKAFTKGNNIYFAPGQFNIYTEAGQELIAHELVHIAQQTKKGSKGNLIKAEIQADELIKNVLSGQRFIGKMETIAFNTLQRKPDFTSPPDIIVYRTNKDTTSDSITHILLKMGPPKEYIIRADNDSSITAYLNEVGITNASVSNKIMIISEQEKVKEKIKEFQSKSTELSANKKESQEAKNPFPNYSGSKKYKYTISKELEHDWNNTGVSIERQDGAPMNSKEAYIFIQREIQSGNIILKNLFPRMQESDLGIPPRFTIPNDSYRIKHYNYNFNPKWKEKFETEEKYEGEIVNIQAKPNNNFKIYEKPSSYSQPVEYEFFDGFSLPRLILKNERITIIAKGNAQNSGWVKIRTADGIEGWVAELPLITDKTSLLKDRYTKDTIIIHKNQTLSSILSDQYTDQIIGFDNYDYAMAVNILNSGSDVIYHEDNGTNILEIIIAANKHIVDKDRTPIRENLKTIKLRYGKELRLPTKDYVVSLRESGIIGTWSTFMNTIIFTGRVTKGLFTGIQDGFISAGTDAIKGLWDMVKGLFNGQLWSDLQKMYHMFFELLEKNPEELFDMLKNLFGGLINEFIDQLKTNNTEDKYYAIGRLVGAIVFEIVVAVLTGGSGTLVNTLNKFDKLKDLVSFVTKVDKGLSKVKSKAKNLLPDNFNKNRLNTPGSSDKSKKVSNKSKSVDLLKMNKNLDNSTPDLITKKKDAISPTRQKEIELETKKNIDADGTHKEDSDNYAEIFFALSQAKMITQAAQESNLSILSLKLLLEPIDKLSPAIKDVVFEKKGTKVNIYLKASKLLVHELFTIINEAGLDKQAQREVVSYYYKYKSSQYRLKGKNKRTSDKEYEDLSLEEQLQLEDEFIYELFDKAENREDFIQSSETLRFIIRKKSYEELLAKYNKKIADAVHNRHKISSISNKPTISGNSYQAHHIVPVGLIEKLGIIRKAIEGGFKFNDDINGKWLISEVLPPSKDIVQHLGKHNKYNERVEALILKKMKLKSIDLDTVSVTDAARFMQEVANEIKSTLDKNKRTKVNDIEFE